MALALAAALMGGCAEGDTDAATEITDTAATLRAHGTTDGSPTTYWFKYGRTAAYGSETAHRPGRSETTPQEVSERIKGLSPATSYHFTACAQNGAGSECGSDLTFSTASAGLLPGFQETTVFNGLEAPTAVRFAPDGRIFVAEKPGAIKVFDGPSDTTATTVANLRPEVNHNWDRGMLGMALDPAFPARPFIYVLYTYDAPIGGTAPTWNDECPTPPGPTTDGCVSSARLSRLQVSGNRMVGDEQVLIEDWCQQGPTHTIGDLHFGPDGALYVSAGEAASPYFVDYGQAGIPRNPCGDPPAGVGGVQAPPNAEGGALRSQDIRTPSDPTTLDGSILRVDPDTGEGLPSNPYAASSDRNARRIVAYGLRNPFRFAIRPGTSEIWAGDVGWNTTEEINRVVNPIDGRADNFGWPCYEGLIRQGGYDAANLSMCESLYGSGAVTSPFFAYEHANPVAPEDTCPTGTSSISGMAFTPPRSTLPAEFDGALFFADYARGCIWVMERNGGTLPSPSRVKVFRAGASMPVDIQFGPDGDLYYVDVWEGKVLRIHHTSGNQAPRAVATASVTSGTLPLSVDFDASGSSDPDPGDTLSYAWDLDADGSYDDATSPQAASVYSEPGTYNVGLRVTDEGGASATDHVAVTAGNTPPTAAIAAPSTGLTWKADDTIQFAGGAVDAQEGVLGPGALSWSLVLRHCPSGCHTHALQTFPGVDRGSFSAPGHEYPSHLLLRLTATDGGGLTDTREILLDPKTIQLSLASQPTGLRLGLNGAQLTAPFTATVIQGSAVTLSAPGGQSLGGALYDFGSWADGGLASRTLKAAATASYTATFVIRRPTKSSDGGTAPTGGSRPSPAPAAAAPPAEPSDRAVARLLKSQVRLVARALRARRASVTRFRALGPGTVRVRLEANLGARRTLVATGVRKFSRAGRATLPLRWSRPGRTMLARGLGLRATLRLEFTRRSGNRLVRSAQITLP